MHSMSSSLRSTPLIRHPWEIGPLRGFNRNVLVVQPVPEDFLCGACQLILRQPVQNQCGHRFCLPCVPEEEIECPSCIREPDDGMDVLQLNVLTVNPDNAQWRRLMKQPAHCPNCDWSGTFGQYESQHYASCVNHTTACTLCGIQVKVQELKDHKEKQCRKRSIMCSKCGEFLTSDHLEQHNLHLCPKVRIQCNSCSAPPMLRELLAEHYEKSCPVTKIPCPYGCPFVFIEPAKMELHEKLCQLDHIRLTNKTAQSVQCSEENDESALLTQESLVYLKRKVETIEKAVLNQPHKRERASVPSPETLEKVTELENQGARGYDKIGSINSRMEKTDDDLCAAELQVARSKKDTEKSISKTEQNYRVCDTIFNDLKKRVKDLEETSYNGTLLWPVDKFSELLRRARNEPGSVPGSSFSVASPRFYTSRYGYCLQMRFYPNGEGLARNVNISVYIQVMKGEYDALLRWPFQQRIVFTLINQKNPGKGDIKQEYVPEETTAAFRMPRGLSNNPPAGLTHFANISLLEGNEFVMNDKLFLKCVVDAEPLT